MPQDDDFDSRLDTVIEFINRIGDKKTNEIKGQTGDGDEVKGYQCRHGDHQYQVITSPAWEHLLIRYQVNADGIWYIRNHMEPNQDVVELSQNEIQEARRELEAELQNYPNVEKREMAINLKQILGREGCSVEFDTITEPFNIHGFTVSKKLFPGENGYSVGEFEKSVQNVISFGWTGQDLIAEYYGLNPDSVSGPPGFQS